MHRPKARTSFLKLHQIIYTGKLQNQPLVTTICGMILS